MKYYQDSEDSKVQQDETSVTKESVYPSRCLSLSLFEMEEEKKKKKDSSLPINHQSD